VFIGARGQGPWQELEMESLLQQFAKRNRPIIPVILEGRLGNPRLPAFLSSWHMVDMRKPNPRSVRAASLGHHRRKVGAAVTAQVAFYAQRLLLPEGAPARQGPQSLASLLTVAQLRAVPATAAEVGPPALASTRRSSLRGYPSGVCR
jgi:hypothetical protein